MRYALPLLLGLAALVPSAQAQRTPCAVVEGVVRTPDGAPVRNGSVGIRDAICTDRESTYAHLDGTGTFRLVVPPGLRALGFSSPYHQRIGRPLTLTAGDTVRVELTASLQPVFAAPLVVGEPSTVNNGWILERSAVARALGLLPLHDAYLQDVDPTSRTRELRLARHTIGSIQRFVRLVNADGQVSGQVVAYTELLRAPEADTAALPWIARETALMRYTEGPRCDSLRTVPVHPGSFLGSRGTEAWLVCYSQFREPPDWAAVWAALETEGVWTLPDESALPAHRPFGGVGWLLSVETRDGMGYRAYSYDTPDGDHPAWAEPRHAFAIAEILDREVYARLLPEGGQARYRGHAVVTPNGGEALFFPCHGSGPWGFDPERSFFSARLQRDDVLFVDAEGFLDMPGRYDGTLPLDPDERAYGPVLSNRIDFPRADSTPPSNVALPRPGDCEAP